MEKIVSNYLKPIYNFTFRLCGSEEDATDITQEVFMKVWKNLKKYNPKQNFKTWIFTIARNTTIDWLRKRKNIALSHMNTRSDDEERETYEEKLVDPLPLPDELFERKELQDVLESALNKISFEQKTVLILHLKEELTFEEISKILEKPLNTVKSQYRRGLIALRAVISSAPK